MFGNNKFSFRKLGAWLTGSESPAAPLNEPTAVEPVASEQAFQPVERPAEPSAPASSLPEATLSSSPEPLAPPPGEGRVKKFFSSVAAGTKKIWVELSKHGEIALDKPEHIESAVAQPVAPPAPMASQPTASMPSTITLSLQPIVEALAPNLKALAKCKGSETISLEALPILTQLASGTVKVCFGELRNQAPSGCLSNNPQYDGEIVEIPLQEVMLKLGQYLPPRRRPKKRLEVPQDIADTFAIPNASRAGKIPRTPARPIEPIPVPVAPPIEPVPQVVTPVPVSPLIPFPDTKPQPVPSVPSLVIVPTVEEAPIVVEPAPVLVMAEAAPQSTPASEPHAAATTQAAPTETDLVIGIADVCEAWPEPVMQEIEAGQLKGASVALPRNRLEPALRAGRIAFTWGELCQWIQPRWTPDLINETIEVELPLDIVAPLFMSQKRSPQARRKVALDETIPDVFAPQRKAAQAPAPVVIPEPTPAPAAAIAEADPDLVLVDELLEQLAKNEWTPQGLATQAARLKGVAILLIATQDGFLVASAMPPHLQAEVVAGMPPHLQGEMLAALFPQLFSKLNEYFTDLEFGKMSILRFTVGSATFGVYKAGDLYLAAVGRSGEKLPEACLEPIAVALAKRSV